MHKTLYNIYMGMGKWPPPLAHACGRPWHESRITAARRSYKTKDPYPRACTLNTLL